jgi:hypothetical protein
MRTTEGALQNNTGKDQDGPGPAQQHVLLLISRPVGHKCRQEQARVLARAESYSKYDRSKKPPLTLIEQDDNDPDQLLLGTDDLP